MVIFLRHEFEQEAALAFVLALDAQPFLCCEGLYQCRQKKLSDLGRARAIELRDIGLQVRTTWSLAENTGAVHGQFAEFRSDAIELPVEAKQITGDRDGPVTRGQRHVLAPGHRGCRKKKKCGESRRTFDHAQDIPRSAAINWMPPSGHSAFFST